MAILQMQKIRIFAHTNDAKKMLNIAQKHGAIEFKEVGDGQKTLADNPPTSTFTESLPEVERASEFLKQYCPLKKVKGDDLAFTEKERKQLLYEYDWRSVVENTLHLQDNIRQCKQKIKELQERENSITPWKTLPVSIPDELHTKNTETALLISSRAKKDAPGLRDILKEKDIPAEIIWEGGTDENSRESSGGRHAVTFLKEHKNKTLEVLRENGWDSIELPDRGETPAKDLEITKKEREEKEKELGLMEDKARNLAGEYTYVLLLSLKDMMAWEKDKEEVTSLARKTDSVLVFEGWCPEKKLKPLKRQLKKSVKACHIQEIKPRKGEVPPTEIDNKSWIKPLESVTRLYGLPGYKDMDPTPYLAGFFVISFGLALTDLGYGIFLMIASVTALKLLKAEGGTKFYLKTLFAGGAAASFFGLLTGGFLGIDPSALPSALQRIQKFDLIENPLPIFYFSLGIGVVQVLFGMVLKIIREYKNQNIKEGIITQGPWIFFFVAAILYGITRIGYIESMREVFLWAVYISPVLIVLSGILNGRTIAGRASKGFTALYSGVGYFSDILSYSRIFALGLATTALAFSVNLIAMILIDTVPVLGYLLAGVVFIGGHLFNIVINTLGAFIHSARLQFVEFFGKFIEDTGKSFKPLRRESSFLRQNAD